MLVTQDYKDFSIISWYGKFEHLTLKTVIVPLPADAIKCFQFQEITDDSENDDTNEEYTSEPTTHLPQEFKTEIINALNMLNRNVFVKNNWHAPVDAKMFSFGNTLKVESIDDIILFFTTSNIVQQDFANIEGVPFCLALRKWISIHPASEFRCIVINGVLRGITPRDWPTFYAHFKEEGPQIIKTILEFYVANIKDKFPRQHYIVDLVLSYNDRPFILDFGPLNYQSNLYAFSWKEISSLLNKDVPDETQPVFRYLESDIGIMTKANAVRKIQQSY